MTNTTGVTDIMFGCITGTGRCTTINRLKCTLATFTLLAGLRWYKHNSLTLDKIGWQTLDNSGTLCSFNEKEILNWTFCLVISLYDVLLLVEERLIWLYHEDIVNDIDLVSLTLPCLIRWNKSL